ncbi:S24/S26 family peptidase [Olivibacter sp. 47]|uniref:S24 family peptidase n=1 Tax=Olivibacter sp. 47 TaxID=3056486 RepID=UPI0025A4B4F7|nr:S24/S26 family peptidase [Olivibacter sp. 47]MDM8176876.1 S24/S26 family peptidase [Olivibacter sp. 47]
MSGNRVIDRLLEYLNYKGISNSKAEKELGLANAYLRNTAKEGRQGSITSDILAKIENTYLDINLIWLITGKGEMLNTLAVNGYKNGNTPEPQYTESDHNYTKSANSLTPKKGKILTPRLTPKLNMGMPHVVTIDNLGRDNVALVPVRARAGYLSGYGDPEYIKELPSYNLPTLRNGTYRAFEIEGHSMTPTLKNHDIVVGEWVENLDHIRDDRVYIVVTKTSGIVVKRVLNRIFEYGFIVAKSDAVNNRQDYPNLKIMPEDIIEIWYARLYISAEFKAPSDMWQRLNDLEAGLEMVKKKLGE